MSPAGGGAQELGVPLGAVAGRVGGSPQAVGLLPMGSGFGNGWWSALLGAAGLKAWPCALPAMGRAVLLVGLQGKTETSLCLVGFGDWEVQCNGSCLQSCVLLFCKPAYWGGKSS